MQSGEKIAKSHLPNQMNYFLVEKPQYVFDSLMIKANCIGLMQPDATFWQNLASVKLKCVVGLKVRLHVCVLSYCSPLFK